MKKTEGIKEERGAFFPEKKIQNNRMSKDC